jgi:hypothetical protein
VVLTCAATVLLLMPQAAAAKPGYYVSRPSHSELLHLKASGNYTVELFSFDPGDLLLTASRFAGLAGSSAGYTQSASYFVARRHPTQSGLDGSFGKLGRISMHFQPSGPPRIRPEPGDNCKGRAPTEQGGRFIGNFRFRGERDFTLAHTTSAKGKVFHSFKRVCKRPHEPQSGGKPERKALSLGAYSKGDPGRAS